MSGGGARNPTLRHRPTTQNSHREKHESPTHPKTNTTDHEKSPGGNTSRAFQK